METPSMARKNQMANGIAATIPEIEPKLKVSAPLQPPLRKLAAENDGATTPMNTSNSKIAISVTASSKPAAMRMPATLRPMKTTYAPTATHFGSSDVNCTLT